MDKHLINTFGKMLDGFGINLVKANSFKPERTFTKGLLLIIKN
jgi:hypothetical protein